MRDTYEPRPVAAPRGETRAALVVDPISGAGPAGSNSQRDRSPAHSASLAEAEAAAAARRGDLARRLKASRILADACRRVLLPHADDLLAGRMLYELSPEERAVMKFLRGPKGDSVLGRRASVPPPASTLLGPPGGRPNSAGPYQSSAMGGVAQQAFRRDGLPPTPSFQPTNAPAAARRGPPQTPDFHRSGVPAAHAGGPPNRPPQRSTSRRATG